MQEQIIAAPFDRDKYCDGLNKYCDGLKFILIQLVVVGHFTLELFSNPIARGITNQIYSFHMPVFIFLSGYFSKKPDITEKM